MAAVTIEERVSKLEAKMAQLVGEQEYQKPKAAWWKKIVGVYKNDPEFEEAERLGREYRESLRPQDSESAA